jgi:hypothetical protein
MVKMLVIGSSQGDDLRCRAFAEALGVEIADGSHQLLNGCRNELDRLVAMSALRRLSEKGLDPNAFITSYVSDQPPAHQVGTILASRCPNWETLASPGLDVPETVQQSDVVIVVGGTRGTECAVNWARIVHKPIVPVAAFGGSAAQIYDLELREFDAKYADRIDRAEYERLNQIALDVQKVAKDAVSVAARVVTPRQVFVAMSFASDPRFDDAYDSIQSVCEEFGYDAARITNAEAVDRILPEIVTGIKRSAFVVVDVSDPRPNVYYELGLAQGAGKRVIVTATKGTALPFDIADIPVIFWEGQKQLKERLRDRIEAIATAQGR